MNVSFQEALRREKAPDKKKNVLNMVTLKKINTNSRNPNHTPDKNVLEKDSGWWKVSGNQVIQEDLKIKKNIRNTNVKIKDVRMKINKVDDCYLSIDYPSTDYGFKPKTLLVTNNQDDQIIHENKEYNLNFSYNRNVGNMIVSNCNLNNSKILSKVGFKEQDKEIKIFDKGRQEFRINAELKTIPNNIMHYCNESKLGIKRFCIIHNECIELEVKEQHDFSKEIIKSNILRDTGLYALDNFGEDRLNNNKINIMYNIKLGIYPTQVQTGWQKEMKMQERGMESLIPNSKTPHQHLKQTEDRKKIPAQPQEEIKKLDMITQENKKTQTQGKEKKQRYTREATSKSQKMGKIQRRKENRYLREKLYKLKKEKLHKLKKEKR